MASDKTRKKAEQLMALAIGTPYGEEGRTAAIAAVKLIHDHKLLERAPQGLGQIVVHSTAEREEIARLSKEIELLKRVRSERVQSAPVQKSLPYNGPTGIALLDAVNHLQTIEALQREVARLRSLPLMPVHVVRSGESPMEITLLYVGDASRVSELVAANPQKPTIVNGGWRTFASLVVGERLRLPDGWTHGG